MPECLIKSTTAPAFAKLPITTVSASLEDTIAFDPAEVDANGRVSLASEKSTIIEMTDDFIDDASVADKMIVTFTLFTSGNGSRDVKIYSDYNIEFKAGIAFKVELN